MNIVQLHAPTRRLLTRQYLPKIKLDDITSYMSKHITGEKNRNNVESMTYMSLKHSVIASANWERLMMNFLRLIKYTARDFIV